SLHRSGATTRSGHGVDALGREGMVDREHARPDDARVVGSARLHDGEVLGREGHRPCVDDFAHAGDEVIARLRHRAADGDDRGVDETHAGGEHLTDVAARLPYRVHGVDVAVLDEFNNVVARLDIDARVAQRARDCGARRHRLEAAAVAAVAWYARTARDLHVADVARNALGAALEASAGNDSGTDTGCDLDEHEVLGVGPRDRALAEGHNVDVVVDEHGNVPVLLHPAGNVEAVPAGHDGRVDGPTGAVLHGAGQSDSDADEVTRVAVDRGNKPAPRV